MRSLFKGLVRAKGRKYRARFNVELIAGAFAPIDFWKRSTVLYISASLEVRFCNDMWCSVLQN